MIHSDKKISIIIPSYNEEASIFGTLKALCEETELRDSEIIVIDDGSKDNTCEIVRQFPQVRLIIHPVNLGYGAAIKTGTRASTGEYNIWFDADGQHRVEDLVKIIRALEENNLEFCFGIRDNNSYEVPNRKLGKEILKIVVRLAAGRPVNDFNTGLRGFKRATIKKYLHLLPDRFGASTVTTLLMIERNHFGGEIPITVKQRIGKSTVNQFKDGLQYIILILRIVILFKPLMFFGLVGFILILIGGVYGVFKSSIMGLGFPVLSSILVLLGFQSFFFGLLSDQISALRRDQLES